MIISVYGTKAFNKVQHPFMILKILKKALGKQHFVYLIQKSITVSILFC